MIYLQGVQKEPGGREGIVQSLTLVQTEQTRKNTFSFMCTEWE